MRPLVLLLSLLFTCLGPYSAVAQLPQSFPSSGEQSTTHINRFAPPGQPTILVNIWGTVGQPGLWRIQPDVDIIELLSVVGVPGLGRDEPDTRQKTIIAVYRMQDNKRREVYRQDLEKILQDGSAVPTVRNGDVLAVIQERRRGFGFSFFTSIVGAASSLTLLLLRLSGSG